MRLSKNFLLEELCETSTGLPNVPTDQHAEKLLYLSNYILQPTRNKWGSITINSGYRSKVVHEELTRRGYPTSKTSQHLLGEAADIRPKEADIKVVWDWMGKNLAFGQLILEYHGESVWIHVSLPRINAMNQQIMIFRGGKYESVG